VLWGWNVSKNTKKRTALVVFEIKGLILANDKKKVSGKNL